MGYLSLLETDQLTNGYYKCIGNYSIIPIINRKYKFSFIGNNLYSKKKRKIFHYRKILLNQFPRKDNHIFINNNESFIYINDAGEKDQKGRKFSIICKDLMEVSFNSEMILSLRGDTLTTDRIFLAFETLSLIGFVGDKQEKEALLRALPFKFSKIFYYYYYYYYHLLITVTNIIYCITIIIIIIRNTMGENNSIY